MLSAGMRLVARQSRPQVLAYAGLMVSTLGWASAFILGKVVVGEMTPLAVAAWRYVVAAAVLLPVAIRQWSPIYEVRAFASLGVMLVFGGIAYPWLFLQSLVHTSATNAALLIALNPVFTLLLSPLIGERIDLRRLGGVALALGGAVTVITRGDLDSIRVVSSNTGDMFAVAAAASWAVFNLASHGAVARFAPAVANFVIYGLGSLALFALGRSEAPVAQLVAAQAPVLGSIAGMALLSSVIAGQFFLIGVRTVGVNRTVVFVYLVPVLTALLATSLLGERFLASQAIGGALVLAGVSLTTTGGSEVSG